MDRETDLWSQSYTYIPDTVGCIKTTREFRSEINIFKNMFQGDYELWAIDTKQPNIIKILSFLFVLETDTELEHEKIIFDQNYNIFMYLPCVYWYRIVINQFCT